MTSDPNPWISLPVLVTASLIAAAIIGASKWGRKRLRIWWRRVIGDTRRGDERTPEQADKPPIKKEPIEPPIHKIRLPTVSPENETPGDEEEIVYLNRSLKDLTREVEGMTDIQREEYVEKNLGGSWLLVEGQVEDVTSARVNTITIEIDHKNTDRIAVSARFNKEKWESRLRVLKRSDRAKIAGKIDSVYTNFVSLRDCRIVDE